MPGSIRLFVEASLAEGAKIAATAGQAHYLATVMRRGVGEPVHLFNGRDGEWLARLTTLGRGQAAMVAQSRLRPQEPEPDLWLAFALLRRDATDLVVQKATELGVSEIHPVITAHTQAERANLVRLGAIATEAAEQCERLTVPTLHPPSRLGNLLAAWPPDRPLYVAAERAGGPPITAPERQAGLLVGPEGGFTQAELDALRARPFSLLVSLGTRILRADTASIVGLALLQARGQT